MDDFAGLNKDLRKRANSNEGFHSVAYAIVQWHDHSLPDSSITRPEERRIRRKVNDEKVSKGQSGEIITISLELWVRYKDLGVKKAEIGKGKWWGPSMVQNWSCLIWLHIGFPTNFTSLVHYGNPSTQYLLSA
ncbi:hypothetical protein AAY473_037764, partial [Plecturocebus cupreus]